MRQDVKGKIFVGMIISVVAFGFATGAGFLIGTNPLSSVGVMNLTKQGEFPSISTTPNNEVTSNDQVTNNTTTTTTTTTNTPTQTNQVKKQNTTANTNTNKNSSSSTSTKTNKTSNLSG
jgi:hypothetical protein